jgi:hypothetical protein
LKIVPSQFGKVTMRKCPVCGHHEVGYVTEAGQFYPLKQGDEIQIVRRPSAADLPENGLKKDSTPDVPESAATANRVVWIAEPLRQDRGLRLKYGVFIEPRFIQDRMSGDVYERAFRQKVTDLIEKEQFLPLPVLLDRFFNSPHLAAGDASEITEALFAELDEIREPVIRMRAWLKTPNEATLNELMQPFAAKVPPMQVSGADAWRRELESLTLEEFFEML